MLGSPEFCGLIVIVPDPGRRKVVQLALRSVHAEAKVVDLCASVQLTQHWVNNTGAPVEATYVFPVDSRAAVSGFEVEIDGEVTKGVVKEKVAARQEYEAAVAAGDSAQLLEQLRDDVFQMTVGNIAAWSTAVVRITYVADLKINGDAVEFFLPTFVAPRYTPRSESDPVPSGGPAPPDGLRFELVAAMASDIVSMESKTPGIALAVSELPGNKRVRTCTLAGEVMSLDRDLVVSVATAEPHAPRCLVEHNPDEGTHAGVVTLCPQIEFDDERRELIFLVDRSGSMGGGSEDSNIEQAKRALQLFFRSLPEDCFINIVGFGSRHEFLWPSSVRYGQDTLEKATRHIEKLRADLGGTEICRPLRELLDKPPVDGYDRQVFVLTDGQVSNTAETIGVVRAACGANPTTRVFALGLGSGASHELVEGMAEAGRGTAAFSVDRNSLQGKVISQLKHAIQPALNDVRIVWEGASGPPPGYGSADAAGADGTEDSGGGSGGGGGGGGGLLAAFAPSSIGSLLGFKKRTPQPANPADAEGIARAPFVNPPVLSGERYLSFVLVAKGGKPPAAVHITAKSPAGDLDVRLPVTAADVVQGMLLHTMAARSLINDLQRGRSWMHGGGGAGLPAGGVSDASVKREIVRLGTTYSLASKHTSFVAVQKKGERWQRDVESERIAAQQQQQRSFTVSRSRRMHAAPRRSTGGAAPRGGPAAYRGAPPAAAARDWGAARGGGGGKALSKSVDKRKKEKESNAKGGKKMDSADFFAAPPPPPGGALSSSMAPPPPPPAAADAPAPAAPAENMLLDSLMGGAAASMRLSRVEKEESMAEEDAWSDEDEDDSCSDSYEAAKSSVADEPAPAPKKPAPAESPEQVLQRLVALQEFSGSFPFGDALAAVVDKAVADLEVLVAAAGVGDADAGRRMVATAVAIAFFRARLAALEDQWELVAAKALKWLAKEAAKHGKTADEFVDAAAAVI